MIDSKDFRQEFGDTAVEDSPRFNLADGPFSAMTFTTGTVTITGAVAKKAQIGNAASKVTHATAPRRGNQRAEIELDFDSVNYKLEVLADGPAGYWRLDESAGTLMADSSQNVRNGSYAGTGFTLGAPGLLPSDSNAAVSLANSTAAALSVPFASGLNTGQWTVEAWVHPLDDSVDRTIASTLQLTGGNYFGWRLYMNTSGQLAVDVGRGTPSLQTLSGAVAADGHVAATFDSASVRLYHNGVLFAGPAAATYSPNTSRALRIGVNLDTGSPTKPWSGRLDEVAVYPGPLSAARLLAHYNAGAGHSLATVARTGVFCRFIDTSNFILLYCNHVSPDRSAVLVERKAGVSTTLATFAPPDSAFGGGRGALRLEVVGRRARYWYESSRPSVRDRPPDGAATLSRAGSDDTPGGWGMYMEANADGTGMRIRRFQARDLADAVLPPPYFTVTNPTGLLNLTPMTLMAAGVGGSAEKVEWEVAPADPDDLPEKLEIETSAVGGGGGSPSIVVMVRPGYAYAARWREQNLDGTFGAWSDWESFTATGSKAAPAGATLPEEIFPDAIPPTYVMPRGQSIPVSAAAAENGRITVVNPWPRPRVTGLKLTFENRNIPDTQILVDFFNDHRGRGAPFTWLHPVTGQAFAMRFTNDEIEWSYPGHAIGNADRPDGEQMGQFSFEMEEVILGGAGEVTMTAVLDPTLY